MMPTVDWVQSYLEKHERLPTASSIAASQCQKREDAVTAEKLAAGKGDSEPKNAAGNPPVMADLNAEQAQQDEEEGEGYFFDEAEDQEGDKEYFSGEAANNQLEDTARARTTQIAKLN